MLPPSSGALAEPTLTAVAGAILEAAANAGICVLVFGNNAAEATERLYVGESITEILGYATSTVTEDFELNLPTGTVDASDYNAFVADVKAIDCDFLTCSAYKFYGPHVGVMYARRNVLDALGTRIDNLTWMQPQTKVRARAKLANFTVKIGYPDQWRSYDGLDIRADDLFGNAWR